jgi:hypothetical protein
MLILTAECPSASRLMFFIQKSEFSIQQFQHASLNSVEGGVADLPRHHHCHFGHHADNGSEAIPHWR